MASAESCTFPVLAGAGSRRLVQGDQPIPNRGKWMGGTPTSSLNSKSSPRVISLHRFGVGSPESGSVFSWSGFPHELIFFGLGSIHIMSDPFMNAGHWDMNRRNPRNSWSKSRSAKLVTEGRRAVSELMCATKEIRNCVIGVPK